MVSKVPGGSPQKGAVSRPKSEHAAGRGGGVAPWGAKQSLGRRRASWNLTAQGGRHRPHCRTDPQEEQQHLVAHSLLQERHVLLDHSRLVRRERRILGARELDAQVHGNPANPRKHADAAVLQLRLAHPLNVLRGRQTHGVKAHITDHAAQVSGLLHERERLALHHQRSGAALPGHGGPADDASIVRQRSQQHLQHGLFFCRLPLICPIILGPGGYSRMHFPADVPPRCKPRRPRTTPATSAAPVEKWDTDSDNSDGSDDELDLAV